MINAQRFGSHSQQWLHEQEQTSWSKVQMCWLFSSMSERPTFASNVSKAQLPLASCLLEPASLVKWGEPNGRKILLHLAL